MLDKVWSGSNSNTGHHSDSLGEGCCGSSGGVCASRDEKLWVPGELLPKLGLEDQQDKVSKRCEVHCELNSMYRGLEECLGKRSIVNQVQETQQEGWGQKIWF